LRVLFAQLLVFLFEPCDIGSLSGPIISLLCKGLGERQSEIGCSTSGHGGV
jgi:hypothetical protein